MVILIYHYPLVIRNDISKVKMPLLVLIMTWGKTTWRQRLPGEESVSDLNCEEPVPFLKKKKHKNKFSPEILLLSHLTDKIVDG